MAVEDFDVEEAPLHIPLQEEDARVLDLLEALTKADHMEEDNTEEEEEDDTEEEEEQDIVEDAASASTADQEPARPSRVELLNMIMRELEALPTATAARLMHLIEQLEATIAVDAAAVMRAAR
jgi:hypothetical protein